MTIRECTKEPCPICGHTGWCARRGDGLILCKRPPTPRETSGHVYRGQAQTLDWIVQHLFRAGPLLDGHREAQVRMATPVLNWLRDVALAVRSRGHLDVWLRATDLIEILSESPGVEIPGLQRTCTVCGEVFAAARPQALYCSPRCKQAILLRQVHPHAYVHGRAGRISLHRLSRMRGVEHVG